MMKFLAEILRLILQLLMKLSSLIFINVEVLIIKFELYSYCRQSRKSTFNVDMNKPAFAKLLSSLVKPKKLEDENNIRCNMQYANTALGPNLQD